MKNIDKKTVSSFGDEWRRFDQNSLSMSELNQLFNDYFNIFPWSDLPDDSEGFDMGCGSGRWASLVAPRVSKLNCIDPSTEALSVAKKNLSHIANVEFWNADVSEQTLTENSQDFGYSIGVLHHVPDTQAGIIDCVKMLKPGAPFLIYLYYRFDNRRRWYKTLWQVSDIVRRLICKFPPTYKLMTTDLLALAIYFPLARLALLFEKTGFYVEEWPLSSYRKASFYTMRTDSRDRFGTPLEKRFTKMEILEMLEKAGLENIEFSNTAPFWCAVGMKACH